MRSLFLKLARIVPHYGKWGGPFYMAGRYGDFSAEEFVEFAFECPPVDSLDELFMHHDIGYYSLPDEFISDWVLVTGIGHLEVNPSKWHNPPNNKLYAFLYMTGAFWAFFVRCGLKKLGILRRFRK